MPPVSQAQRRWAWSQKDKDTEEGRAAREFAEADQGGKLPAKVEGGKPVSAAERRYARKPKA
jgi:hypothetical protein